VALQVPPSLRGLGIVDRRFVSVADAAGVQIHVWTVNDMAAVSDLWALGVHGVITDRPDQVTVEL